MQSLAANVVSSCAGLLSVLNEAEDSIKIMSLNSLVQYVDKFWPEIADHIPQLEGLFETEKFEGRLIASFLLSKVYYYLGEYDEALKFALLSRPLFQVEDSSVFTNTIVARAINRYIGGDKSDSIISLLDDLFAISLTSGDYFRCLGVAFECQRLDVMKGVFEVCKDPAQKVQLLKFSFEVAKNSFASAEFRLRAIELVVYFAEQIPDSVLDHFFVFDCYIALKDVESFAKKLVLMNAEPSNSLAHLTSVQVSFDFFECAPLKFRTLLFKCLENLTPSQAPSQELLDILKGVTSTRLYLEFLCRNNRSDLLVLENVKNAMGYTVSHHMSATVYCNALMHAGTTCDDFLRKNVDWLKHAVNWAKFSVSSGIGLIHRGNITNGFEILKDYLPSTEEGENSTSSSSNSSYLEGGALLALGLIYSNQNNTESLDFLLEAVKKHKKEALVYGACLGLGSAAIASGNTVYSESLLAVLFGDDAVMGEAAATAIGLVMLGTADLAVYASLIAYTNETQHEKIRRAAAVSIAMIFFGQEDNAMSIVDHLIGEKDFIVRFGGMMTLGMAYAGTGNNYALKTLTHFAVSDSSDEVRRAAAIAIGFIFLNEPEKVPEVLKLLSQNYNPHVRYGCALALGIACSGGSSSRVPRKEIIDAAVQVIEPLLKDKTDFVRQAAYIAMSMCYMQCAEAFYPKITAFRAEITKCITGKYEDTLVKFGATIAQGLIDAGGRNVAIRLFDASSSHLNMVGIAGTLLFANLWHFHRLIPFISLGFKPVAFIGTTAGIRCPSMKIQCNTKPSLFAYPEPTKVASNTDKEKTTAAVLSTTHKALVRARKLEKNKMDLGESKSVAASPMVSASTSKTETKPTESKETEASKPELVEEPSTFTVENFGRVTLEQAGEISFFKEDRFHPITACVNTSECRRKFAVGITVLCDQSSDVKDSTAPFEEVVFVVKPKSKVSSLPPAESGDSVAKTASDDSKTNAGEEAAPPEAFELME